MRAFIETIWGKATCLAVGASITAAIIANVHPVEVKSHATQPYEFRSPRPMFLAPDGYAHPVPAYGEEPREYNGFM